jgi:hypothetical protein
VPADTSPTHSVSEQVEYNLVWRLNVKKIIAVVMLSVVSVSVFGQRVVSPERIFTDQKSYVAEPSARLARCGRMDFAEHLIDVYVDLFANSLRTSPGQLRERTFPDVIPAI